MPSARRPRFRAPALAAAAVLAVLPPARPGPAAAVFDPVTFRLDNGLQVVVVENRRAPVVVHMLWYKVGAADEPPGKSGVAHFLEHLMFKGTPTTGPERFSRIVARNGGMDNAFTGYDYTAYFQRVASDKLELVMRLEADRMVNLDPPEAEVETEREVVLEERRSRTGNDPGAQLAQRSRAVAWLRHPYRIPIIGWEPEIRGLTRADALAFYRARYAPNNAVLIVSGDAAPEEVRALAERHYGPIPARPVPPRRRPQEPAPLAAKRVTMKSARVHLPRMTISWRAPSLSRGAVAHVHPLTVLAEILGGGTTSRLYRRLVVERGIASSVGAWYDSDALDESAFTISARPKAGGALAPLEAAVAAELRRMVEDGPEDAELVRARRALLASAVYARDGVGAAARVIGRALTTGGTIADVETWPERVGRVTARQVRAAARAVLVESRSVTAVLLPETPG